MKKLLSSLLLSVAATSALTTSAQAGTFYVSTNNGKVGAIDDSTGFYTQLASTPTFTDIALDPMDELWGITFSQLYSVNLAAGTHNYIGNLGASLNALGFTDDGVLYGAGGSRFYSIDTNSGAASLISSISGFISSGDIVFDAARNLFWATSSGDSLWTITQDGAATKVGNIGYRGVFGLAFGDDGTLFGYTANRKQLALNLETGAGTFVRNISGLNASIWGAASEPDATETVPEPGMVVGLLSVGALFVGSRLKRK
ncbi:MAG: PEP-CTERM sorting domain-containing protein [Okeania sp. SIO3I5]|uniref:PEP-CTERM sorting domain-containing protein n=1 Tax=Okeania sp. SIO3I5 TaxID=2607805 RepID=UPI0013BBD179|nr:PEP-CTERM sorting domain-containing protein [Okeania sp. SIO3I5]NEQ35808.1 PEP-CTERM sorting domain-containing protein [Okeania sp. SIO3I5]